MQLEEEGVADPGVELRYMVDELYGSLSETELILKDLEVGMLCCVKEGCGWVIAVVCDNTNAGKLVVKSVDYGGTATIDRQNVKQLDGPLCRLAPLAIQCCFPGVHQTDEKEWSNEAYVQLCGLIEYKDLTADFQTSDTLPYTVSLWNKMTNVGDKMISAIQDDDAKASTDTKIEVTLN